MTEAAIFFYEAADGLARRFTRADGLSLHQMVRLVRSMGLALIDNPNMTVEQAYIDCNGWRPIHPVGKANFYRDKTYWFEFEKNSDAFEAEWTHDEIANVHWIVHPDRFNDLGIEASRQLRNAVHVGVDPSKKKELKHLPSDRIKMLVKTLQADLPTGIKGRKIVTPEQFALLMHFSRLGASARTCATAPLEPVKMSIMQSEIRSTAMSLYTFEETRTGWDWVGTAIPNPATPRPPFKPQP